MKIIGLHVFGYGKFHDFRLDSIGEFQVFFGENEAGKSTLMSFIHSVLFGFPTKQQSELRYEPKTHGHYGGRLILESGKHGILKVERVRGKAAGDVHVLLEDGTSGGEDLLAELLGEMDKGMYQNIFSFNLDGLQQVHRLKDEEIARYLIAAGTVGTDTLLQLDGQLDKEMEALFKPNGRKPELNVQLQELRTLEKKLKEAKSQNGRYQSLCESREELEKNINDSRKRIGELAQEKDQLETLQKKWPILIEYKELSGKIARLGNIRFPEDGLLRFEKQADARLQLMSRTAGVEERIRRAMEKLGNGKGLPSELLVQAEKLYAEWPRQLHEQDELKELQKEFEESEKRAAFISRELHINGEGGIRDKVNVGLDQKVKLKSVLQRFDRAELDLTEVQGQLKKEGRALDSLEKECSQIEEQLLPEQEWKSLKEKFERLQSIALLEAEKRSLEENLLQEKSIRDRVKRQRTKLGAVFALMGLLGVVLSIAKDSSGMWAGPVVIILSIVSSVFIWRGEKFEDTGIKGRIDKLEIEIAQLKADEQSLLQFYNKAKSARESWKESFSRLEETERRISKLAADEKEKRTALAAINDELAAVKAAIGLQPDYTNAKLEEAFEYMKELVSAKERQSAIRTRIENLVSGLRRRSALLEQLANEAGVRGADDQETLILLKEALKKDQEKAVEIKSVKRRLLELKEEKAVLLKEMEAVEKEIGILYSAAGVSSEEEFRKMSRLSADKAEMEERLTLLELQAGAELSFPDGDNPEKISRRILAIETSIDDEIARREEMARQLARTSVEIQTLEEGGTYSERLHTYQRHVSKFNEDAKRWEELAAAKMLLQETMDLYKKERLPRVLELAEEYFSFLTDSEYSFIHPQNDGLLLIERHDGMLFKPGELSRGTGEQLYTALRLALAGMLHTEYPLPVIIDDGFVNFDRKRAGKVLDLLSRLSSEMQVLFFTCQPHLASPFTEEQVILLERGSGRLVRAK